MNKYKYRVIHKVKSASSAKRTPPPGSVAKYLCTRLDLQNIHLWAWSPYVTQVKQRQICCKEVSVVLLSSPLSKQQHSPAWPQPCKMWDVPGYTRVADPGGDSPDPNPRIKTGSDCREKPDSAVTNKAFRESGYQQNVALWHFVKRRKKVFLLSVPKITANLYCICNKYTANLYWSRFSTDLRTLAIYSIKHTHNL